MLNKQGKFKKSPTIQRIEHQGPLTGLSLFVCGREETDLVGILLGSRSLVHYRPQNPRVLSILSAGGTGDNKTTPALCSYTLAGEDKNLNKELRVL